MNKRRFQRSALLACGLLLLLLAVPVMLTWRAWRQAQRDHVLITAIKGEQWKAALFALRNGANPNTCDKSDTPFSLWLFIRNGLVSSPLQGKQGPSALALAVYSPEETTAETVFLVKALLERGADPNAPDFDGYSLLFEALKHESQRQVFTLLVQHGAKVNVKNTFGETPLMRVAGYDAELTRLLLDSGADMNYMTEGGGTALGYAINGVTLGNKDTVVRLLIARHANVNAVKDKELGNYYLWMARRFNEPGITTLLKKAGATP